METVCCLQFLPCHLESSETSTHFFSFFSSIKYGLCCSRRVSEGGEGVWAQRLQRCAIRSSLQAAMALLRGLQKREKHWIYLCVLGEKKQSTQTNFQSMSYFLEFPCCILKSCNDSFSAVLRTLVPLTKINAPQRKDESLGNYSYRLLVWSTWYCVTVLQISTHSIALFFSAERNLSIRPHSEK